MKHSTRLAAAALVLCICGAGALRLNAADEKPAGDAKATAAVSDAKARYFEMRIYTAAPGKMDALHARFRDHTLKLFKKHGIDSIAYWTAVDEKNQGKLYFVIAYPDKESRDKNWNAFANDPDWVKAKAESEKDGTLVTKVEQVFMTGTDYSPVK